MLVRSHNSLCWGEGFILPSRSHGKMVLTFYPSDSYFAKIQMYFELLQICFPCRLTHMQFELAMGKLPSINVSSKILCRVVDFKLKDCLSLLIIFHAWISYHFAILFTPVLVVGCNWYCFYFLVQFWCWMTTFYRQNHTVMSCLLK